MKHTRSKLRGIVRLIHSFAASCGEFDPPWIKTPDGRVLKSYNLAYIIADAFKDLLILDEILWRVNKPDLIIFTVNSYTFAPVTVTHGIAQANPDNAIRLRREYNLSAIPLEGVTDNSWLASRNFWAERSDIVAWLKNQVYSLVWAESQVDYPPLVPGSGIPFAGTIPWENTRPGILNATVSLAARHNIPLLLISVPVDYTSSFSGWIREQAEELKIPLLDCSSLLPPESFTNTILHISAQGQQRFAERVSDWLKSWLLNPGLRGQTVTYCPSWHPGDVK
jgi:hypothetical protein